MRPSPAPSLPSPLPDAVQALVGEAWAFRWRVELDAQMRFARMASRLTELEGSGAVIEATQRSSGDEGRHAEHCARLAGIYGAPLGDAPTEVEEIAPRSLGLTDRVLYEFVAACCVTETVSVAVLGALVQSQAESGTPMDKVLRELMRDEVVHGRIGWAHLAEVKQQRSVSFLSELIPFMLEGTESDELFQQAAPTTPQESPLLLSHGVLPLSTKRALFEQTLDQVVFPGLEHLGIDSRPARDWLRRKAVR